MRLKNEFPVIFAAFKKVASRSEMTGDFAFLQQLLRTSFSIKIGQVLLPPFFQIKSFFFWFEKDGALALKLEKVREEKGRERRKREREWVGGEGRENKKESCLMMFQVFNLFSKNNQFFFESLLRDISFNLRQNFCFLMSRKNLGCCFSVAVAVVVVVNPKDRKQSFIST